MREEKEEQPLAEAAAPRAARPAPDKDRIDPAAARGPGATHTSLHRKPSNHAASSPF